MNWNIALAGGIYTKNDGVTNELDNKVADYEGAAALALSMTFAEAFGQNLFRQESALTRVAGSLNISTVALKGQTIGSILGITGTEGKIMSTASPTATVWELDNTLANIEDAEWLLEVLRSGDSKLFQTWAAAARLGGDMPISFIHGEKMAHDISLILSTDDDGKFVRFIKEQ